MKIVLIDNKGRKQEYEVNDEIQGWLNKPKGYKVPIETVTIRIKGWFDED